MKLGALPLGAAARLIGPPAPPFESGVAELFAARARAHPERVAVVHGDARATYGDVDRASSQVAGFLAAHGVGPGDVVGVLMERGLGIVAALLGIFKTRAAYLPLHPAAPGARLRTMVERAAPRVLLVERAQLGRARELLYSCASLAIVLCADSADAAAELEPPGRRMSTELWDLVASRAANAVEAGGWKSSYTGAPLGARIMDDYGASVRSKLAPLLGPRSRVLEIGCGSGLTLVQIAPLVARYIGIDLSDAALERARAAGDAVAAGRVALHCLAAHQLDQLDETAFDVVILNSVVQSFPGLGYLQRVLALAIARLAPRGWIFLGNLWDLATRDAFIASLDEFRRSHPDAARGSIRDHADALFVSRGFLDDLAAAWPAVIDVTTSALAISEPCELSEFSFDALLRVDRTVADPRRAPARQVLDRRSLPEGSGGAPAPAAPDDLAYVLFTSGSTGDPKGAEIEMHALVNLCAWYRQFCAIDERSVVLHVIPSSFDASIKNFVAPLLAGGRLVLLPEGPFDPESVLRSIAEHAVTVVNPGVPSMMYPVIRLARRDGYAELRSLRHLALGGEAMVLDELRPWLASDACGCRIANIYGPTECTDIALCHELSDHETMAAAEVPAGRPLPGIEAVILGSVGVPEPPGVIGELCLGGLGLARGYCHDPEATARRFVPHPLRPGDRLLRTGDLAALRADGNIALFGRKDHQVKVRGFRVELPEIERHLAGVPGVTEAAVVCRGDATTGHLCAYVVPRSVSPDELRDVLLRHLPDHMVPSRFVTCDALPRSLHGKIDRQALVRLDEDRAPGPAPRTPAEALVLEAWRRTLARDEPGERAPSVTDAFFEVGGQSLSAVSLAHHLEELAGVPVPLSVIYRHQTIEAQAAWLADQRTAAAAGPALHAAAAPPVFCFPPIVGLAASFGALAQRLEEVCLVGFDFEPSIEAYLREIGRRHPAGPVVLCGYSAGGALAYATAHALETRGRNVAHLILLDATWPADRPSYGVAGADALADECAADPRFATLCRTPEARRQLCDRVRAYARWLDRFAPGAAIRADITLIAAAGADPGVAEPWRRATRGQLRRLAGAGRHDELLDERWVGVQAALMRSVITGLRDRPPTANGGWK